MEAPDPCGEQQRWEGMVGTEADRASAGHEPELP